MRALAVAAALLVSGGEPTTTEPPSRTFAVRCHKLYVGDGVVLTDATMVVVDGRIQAVGSGPRTPTLPADMPILDASDKIVMPGIVLADTDLSGHGDGKYNVTPDFVALDGFDFVRVHGRPLSGGVTTAYLSPGRGRLISGQGSVVKLHGDDLVQRVLAENACLRVNMGTASTKAPVVFEPTPTPTADDPLVPARQQYPTARISVLPVLRKMFREALATDTDADGRLAGEGADEDHYSVEPLRQTARGSLPLRISLTKGADAKRALFLARELGARLVLENPQQIGAVAASAADGDASAVFRIPVRPGQSNPGGEDRRNKSPLPSPNSAVEAAAAGMRIALTPSSTADLIDTLLVAGLAIRAGLTPEQAMRAITGDAAAILGVQDRVGTLARGRDADFLVLSGEPFAIGTMVEKTFIDGEVAWQRKTSPNVLAVRVGRILTMTGRTYRDGMLIVQDGTIKAVGEDLSLPYGARLLDLGDGVMMPGFIDAYSHLGLSGDGSGIPTGAADQRVADVVRHDDPLFKQALQEGLTTVLVSGRDAGAVSGRVAAIKTGAKDHEKMVLRETAALRFVFDGIGPDAIKSLQGTIDRGAKYLESWQKYEKALAEWKSGERKAKPAEEKPKVEEVEKADPVSGDWELEFVDGPPFPITLELKLAGKVVTGKLIMEMGSQTIEANVDDGLFENGTLTCKITMMGSEGSVTAKVADDEMTGTIQGETRTTEFTGRRVDAPEQPTAGEGKKPEAEKSDEPKKPAVDESLEPLRALLQNEIPAIVRTNKAPAIESVVKLFEDKKLSYVLTGLKDAVDTPEILGPTKPAVLLGPNLIQRKGQKLTNAAAVLSDRGHTVALGTGDTAGARYLPLHAALAVRYGMDPTEALKAMTIHAARMFKLDDRIGSLERGKDADFVVFSGSPFEMTSRVKLVVVNGEVVVDQRKKGAR